MAALDSDSEDLPWLWDIREAGLGVIRMTRGLSPDEFQHDADAIAAAERGLSVIGRAARLLSPGLKAAHPEIPWRRFQGAARLLADSDDVLEPEELWALVRELPALVRGVTALMPEDRDELT